MAQGRFRSSACLEDRSDTCSCGVLWAIRHALVTIDVSRGATVRGQSLDEPGGGAGPDPRIRFPLGLGWASLTAPSSATVLTILYDRLTEPERPIIHEDVRRWTSVWAGPTAEG